jgi:hypothetical protein
MLCIAVGSTYHDVQLGVMVQLVPLLLHAQDTSKACPGGHLPGAPWQPATLYCSCLGGSARRLCTCVAAAWRALAGRLCTCRAACRCALHAACPQTPMLPLQVGCLVLWSGLQMVGACSRRHAVGLQEWVLLVTAGLVQASYDVCTACAVAEPLSAADCCPPPAACTRVLAARQSCSPCT